MRKKQLSYLIYKYIKNIYLFILSFVFMKKSVTPQLLSLEQGFSTVALMPFEAR